MAKNIPFPLKDANQTVIESYDDQNSAHRVEPVINGQIVSSSNPLPVGNLGTSPIFVNSLPFVWDYVSMALSNGNTTETYTFKTGGSGGATTGTVVINYTNSTRDVLLNATVTAV